uniref:Uncharacterized protein n=1 Tax=Laticauda laticaudata TaxID=8630 RepID=A0A8C5WP85_LATLA
MGSKTKAAPDPPGKEQAGLAAPPGKKSPQGPSDPGEEARKASKEEDVHTCCGCRFPLLLALMQLVLGVSITVLAFLMAQSSPSLLLRETPYWAGFLQTFHDPTG